MNFHDAATKPTKKLPLFTDYLDSYKIICKVSDGSMGSVYKAQLQHQNNIIPVAIKFFDYAIASSIQDIHRFIEEARTTAKLKHPNIIKIYDVQQRRQYAYIVMEFIDGMPLNKAVQEYNLDLITRIEIIKKIALILEYTHKNQVIHRDIKPQNILVDKNAKPILTDFGISKNLERTTDLTLKGQVLGTPQYIAPEQMGKSNTKNLPAADIYSLGAVLYEMLTGEPPFKGGTDLETLFNVANTSFIPPHKKNPDTPIELSNICAKALSKKPKDRYLNAREFARALGTYLNKKKRKPNRSVDSNSSQLHMYVLCIAIGMLLATFFATSYFYFTNSNVPSNKNKSNAPKTTMNKNVKSNNQVNKVQKKVKEKQPQENLIFLKAELQQKKQKNDFDAALDIAMRIEKQQKNDLGNLVEIADLHRIQKNYLTAIEYCDKAIAFNSTYAQAYGQKAYVYFSLQQYDLCLEELQKCLRYTKDRAQTHTFMAQTYLKKNQPENAIIQCNKAIAIDPQFTNAYFHRGMAYKIKQQLPLVVQDFSTILRFQPRSFISYLERGGAFLQMRQFDKAASDFDQAIAIEPNNSLGYLNKGNLLITIQKNKLAEENLEKAAKLNPNDLTNFQVARVLAQKKPLLPKDVQHMIKHLNITIQANSRFVQAYLLRANSYARLQNISAAIKDYKQVIAIAPGSQIAQNAQQLLQQYSK